MDTMPKSSIFPEFPNRLDADSLEMIMEDLDVSASVLALRLDVDRKTVVRWLKGTCPIPGSVALLLMVAHAMLRFTHDWRGPGVSAFEFENPITEMLKRQRTREK